MDKDSSSPEPKTHLLHPSIMGPLALKAGFTPKLLHSSSLAAYFAASVAQNPKNSNLKIHEQISSSLDIKTQQVPREKSFVCRICNNSFGYKHVLQNHERIHSGQKPFQCNLCGRKFTRDHHLKTHYRIHTGEKPYHCQHCNKDFVQVANLRRHLRTHTGEKPYTCIQCASKFADSNQLKAHLLTHVNAVDNLFSCNNCGQEFRRRHHLIQHKCNESEKNSVNREVMLRLTPLPIVLPEQTEPEDLSISKTNNNNNNNNKDDLWSKHKLASPTIS